MSTQGQGDFVARVDGEPADDIRGLAAFDFFAVGFGLDDIVCAIGLALQREGDNGWLEVDLKLDDGVLGDVDFAPLASVVLEGDLELMFARAEVGALEGARPFDVLSVDADLGVGRCGDQADAGPTGSGDSLGELDFDGARLVVNDEGARDLTIAFGRDAVFVGLARGDLLDGEGWDLALGDGFAIDLDGDWRLGVDLEVDRAVVDPALGGDEEDQTNGEQGDEDDGGEDDADVATRLTPGNRHGQRRGWFGAGHGFEGDGFARRWQLSAVFFEGAFW